MLQNLAIDDHLLKEAKEAGSHGTVEEAVIAALQEYIRHFQRLELINAFGTVDFDPGYDYKAERSGKRR